jgi:hypothetical protein
MKRTQDLCGVGYYSLDSNEVNVLDAASPLEAMFGPMSYSESFLPAVLKAATKRGITTCWWAVAQYDFKYDPKRVKRAIAPQPVFLGVFKYVAKDAARVMEVKWTAATRAPVVTKTAERSSSSAIR